MNSTWETQTTCRGCCHSARRARRQECTTQSRSSKQKSPPVERSNGWGSPEASRPSRQQPSPERQSPSRGTKKSSLHDDEDSRFGYSLNAGVPQGSKFCHSKEVGVPQGSMFSHSKEVGVPQGSKFCHSKEVGVPQGSNQDDFSTDIFFKSPAAFTTQSSSSEEDDIISSPIFFDDDRDSIRRSVPGKPASSDTRAKAGRGNIFMGPIEEETIERVETLSDGSVRRTTSRRTIQYSKRRPIFRHCHVR